MPKALNKAQLVDKLFGHIKAMLSSPDEDCLVQIRLLKADLYQYEKNFKPKAYQPKTKRRPAHNQPNLFG